MANKNLKIYIYKDNSQKQSVFLNLCSKVLKKNIPDSFDVFFIDRDNVFDFVDLSVVDKNLLNDMDYLKLAVLYFNGGIFLDADVLMTNQALPLLACFNDFELIVFGESLVKISKKFIMAKKNSDILRLLMDKRKNLNKNDIFSWSKILADCNDDFDFNKIVVLDAEKNGFLGEKSLFGVSGSYIYQNCYFKNIVELQEFLQVFQGIVALEESWIPDKYQKLTQEEFLEEDLLISKIFKTLLI